MLSNIKVNYTETIPKCAWCQGYKNMKIKTVWFEVKKKKHFVHVWMCMKCNANNGVHYYG